MGALEERRLFSVRPRTRTRLYPGREDTLEKGGNARRAPRMASLTWLSSPHRDLGDGIQRPGGSRESIPVRMPAASSVGLCLCVFSRPGDVKDFLKKVRLEDSRIEMRRGTLARQAERIAAARAKAAGVGTPTSTTGSQEAAAEQNKPTASAAAGDSPLHPSLPAKPGSASPSKTSESSQGQPTPAPTSPILAPVLAERVPTPTPTPAAPAAITIPPDDQILKLEEVTCLTFVPRKRTCDLKLAVL